MKQGNVEADDCVKSHVSALPLSLLENISSCWQDSTQQAKALWAMAATLDPRVHKDMNFTTEKKCSEGACFRGGHAHAAEHRTGLAWEQVAMCWDRYITLLGVDKGMSPATDISGMPRDYKSLHTKWLRANIKRGNVWVAPLSVKVQA